jgi:GTP-binding protein
MVQGGFLNKKTGKSGRNINIELPLGTIVFKNNKIFTELRKIGDKILIVKGGRGGRGNCSFKTKNNTVPRISENGQRGEFAIVVLEPHFIADVGLIGLPNAGKSTLLAKISNAKPKIAEYPFTTLIPSLGTVDYMNRRFIIADIPGIIKDAHIGKGLGFNFLRYIKRTKILVYVIDSNCSIIDIYNNYMIINNELKKYSDCFEKKKKIIVLSKIDLYNTKKRIKLIKRYFKHEKIIKISAVNGYGINILLNEILKKLNKYTECSDCCNISGFDVKEYVYEQEFNINIDKNGIFIVSGQKIETITEMTNFNEYESLKRYQNILKKFGLDLELKKKGIKIGDVVKICNYEFTFEE